MVAVVPAGDPGGRVGPDHVNARAALFRVLVVDELVLAGCELLLGPPPIDRPLKDGSRYQALGHEVEVGVGGSAARVSRYHAGEHRCGRRRDRLVVVVQTPLDHLGLVAAGPAQPLHGQAEHLQAGGLGGIRPADGRTTVADDHGRSLGGPLSRQGLDGPGRHPGDRRRPLGSLGHPVFPADDIGLELLHPIRMRFQVVLVVCAAREPLVRDGQVESRVGVRQDGDPLVGVDRVGIVAVGRDVDLPDTQLTPPEAQPTRKLALPSPRGRLLVTSPEKQQLRVLRDVPDEVLLRHLLAHRLTAPDVFCPPPPAFPTVGLADLQGVAAEQAQQLAAAAVRTMDHLVLAVLIGLVKDGLRPVLLLHPQHLAGDDVERLVPGDTHVLAHSPVLDVAPTRTRRAQGAAVVEVHPLHREADARRGIDAFLVHDTERRDQALVARFEGLAPGVHHPGLDFLPGVLVVVAGRPDADDPAVLGVHHRGVGSGAGPAPTQVPDGGPFLSLTALLVPTHLGLLNRRAAAKLE